MMDTFRPRLGHRGRSVARERERWGRDLKLAVEFCEIAGATVEAMLDCCVRLRE